MTRAFSRDPFWMAARLPGLCTGPGCGIAFPKGTDVFYNPVTHKTFARPCGCGATAEQRFYAARSDADMAKVTR